ncbi:hypothetical protein QFC21_001397 [Naganishia friedmannii]|uniref:Uncharacterized protein n=1 Tax=Naganishia friedmannii TaxID=89922 RepID=A0ACC2W3R6_9TREE|nr:hypothetical protein QFC21_001397 [Naganishia friedmannii]
MVSVLDENQVCGATFTRPQHVGRHMRSHTGDKPYQCKECPEKFARSDLLSRHVNKTHGSPGEGDGKGNGKLGAGGRKKARKPKFIPSALASQQVRNQINPPIFNEHGQTQRHSAMTGQHLPNLQSPFTTQAFRPIQNIAYMQPGQDGYTTNPSASSHPQAMGRMTTGPQVTPPYGMAFAHGTDNVIVPGYEVDEEDDDDDQWVNVPYDYNGFNAAHAQQVPFYIGQQQQQQQHHPTASEITMQQHQTHLPLPSYYMSHPGAIENPSLSDNPQSSMEGPYASFSPSARPAHGVQMMHNISEPSPQLFWSESPQQSSPLYPGMPVYSHIAHHNISNSFVGANAYGSSSPYSLPDPARLVQTSESPSGIGRNSMMRNGSSPLAPSPAGMMHPGPLPTAYSSVMPAPLVPTGTPLVDRVEKVKKRACEACNQSKVKCDFEIPCGKCASRKLACVYPTSRKPNRKTTFSSSPLSPETSDTARPTLISPDSAGREIQPMLLSTQEASKGNGLTASPTSLTMQGGIVANATTSNYQQSDGSQPFSSVHPDGQPQPFSIDMSTVQSQAYPTLHANMVNTGVPTSATFIQMRQVNEEDSQSSVSGQTFGAAAGVDSRRSSLAEPFAAGDQQIDSTLPFDALNLNGTTLILPGMSNDIDVQQWISNSVAVQAKTETPIPLDDGSAPRILPQQTVFWEGHPAGLHDSNSGLMPVPPAAAHTNQREMTFLSRPALVRGRSNSVPALYTPRAGMGPTQYFGPLTKDSMPNTNYEHSVLPQDWNVQIQHMTSQLNRNGSGTSSLQQVEDSIDATTQLSPQTHMPSPDGTLLTAPLNAASTNASLTTNRPGPAVIQNNMSLTMAKQLLAGRGSLQTLAPERTASFLDSTPSAELDGMKWNINSAQVGGSRIESPSQMPNHLVRPGNKRLASQTLGPDMQKRQSISSLEDGLARQQSSLNPQVDRMTTMFAPQSVMTTEQFSARRASIPSWLPDPASGNQGLMNNVVNHNMTNTPANQSMYLGRSVMDRNSNIPPSFFPDLTPTLFDPMQQGFNFNPSDLNTPTYERGALALNQIM